MNKSMPASLLGLLAAISLTAFDLFQPTLPTITKVFATTHAKSQLTLSCYLLFLGIGQFIWGPLVDVYGRRKPFFFSMFIFVAATLLCVFAPSIEIMIVGRALQAVSIAVSAVIAFVATRDCDDTVERAKRMSMNSVAIALSPIFSPIIGALLFRQFGWQSNFIFMLILGATLITYSYFKLNESPHFVKGKTLSITSLLSSYHCVLRSRVFNICNILLMLSFSCSIIFVINASYILMIKLKLSAVAFSYVFGLFGVFIILGNMLGVKLRESFTLAYNVYFGNCLILLGSALMAVIFYTQGEVFAGMLPMSLVVMGVAIILPAVQTKGLEPFADNAGTASSLLTTSRTIGSSLIGGMVGVFLNKSLLLFPLSILCSGLIILAIYSFAIPQEVKQKRREL